MNEPNKENQAETPELDKETSYEVIAIDNSVTELFDKELSLQKPKTKLLSYIPSFFTTASLPFKNIHKTVFVRRGSQGVKLTLSSPFNVPFGKYGRLLLSIFTTHAVLSKEKDAPVYMEFRSLADLLKEMQLPRQRGSAVREQLECFMNASFAFDQRVEERQAGDLFKDLYQDGNYPKKDVNVVIRSTGNIRFTEGIQFKEIEDGSAENKFGDFKIILSAEFARFCQQHAVPIDYTVYRDINSAVGKDLYAWLVFRNNGITNPVFIPKESLVDQFMPVTETANPNQRNVNYNRLIDMLAEIKTKYYPELNIDLDSNSLGITLFKSPTPVIKNDKRYALITSLI